MICFVKITSPSYYLWEWRKYQNFASKITLKHFSSGFIMSALAGTNSDVKTLVHGDHSDRTWVALFGWPWKAWFEFDMQIVILMVSWEYRSLVCIRRELKIKTWFRPTRLNYPFCRPSRAYRVVTPFSKSERKIRSLKEKSEIES